MTLAITLLVTSIVCLLIAVFLSWRSANIRIHFEVVSSSDISATDTEDDPDGDQDQLPAETDASK